MGRVTNWVSIKINLIKILVPKLPTGVSDRPRWPWPDSQNIDACPIIRRKFLQVEQIFHICFHPNTRTDRHTQTIKSSIRPMTSADTHFFAQSGHKILLVFFFCFVSISISCPVRLSFFFACNHIVWRNDRMSRSTWASSMYLRARSPFGDLQTLQSVIYWHPASASATCLYFFFGDWPMKDLAVEGERQVVDGLEKRWRRKRHFGPICGFRTVVRLRRRRATSPTTNKTVFGVKLKEFRSKTATKLRINWRRQLCELTSIDLIADIIVDSGQRAELSQKQLQLAAGLQVKGRTRFSQSVGCLRLTFTRQHTHVARPTYACSVKKRSPDSWLIDFSPTIAESF